ncbi:specifically androgen-regulated gene protein isoform X1 [Dromaius novaehollandiae]|uniref:specifically androgen-regulated gene protein isoform X1 n=2 Tax=Dromaius novaehollandiae TaxID=8790 RepID=UPI0031201F12
MATAAGDMPKKGLWLGMASCNSGSCDSVASTTSNRSERSDNSYDYLSVEEKECLMFLEETIGSLDAEADSGVSTDETDSAEPGTRPRRDSAPRGLENGAPAQGVGQRRAAEQKGQQTASAFSSPAPAAGSSPGYYSLPRNIAAARASNASDGKATARPTGDPAPAHGPPREMAEEERMDRAGTSAPAKPPGLTSIPPPEAFQDVPAVRGGLMPSEGSGAGGEPAQPQTAVPDPGTGRESAAAARGQPEKPASEEDSEAKRGPPTAPKPRKLPPNIILRTSRNSPVPLAPEPGHRAKSPSPAPAGCATAERASPGRLDPQEREKARREALEKLGLPRDEREPGTPPKAAPAPKPKEAPGAAGDPHEALAGSLPRVAPGARHVAFKSNTLERSGVGLSSYISGKEQSAKSSSSLGKMSFIERIAPSFLRSSRPRPGSLGTGRDFAGLAEHREPEKGGKRRSQALPGSSKAAVSVKISPRGTAAEHRREALRKLGLLKD